MTADARAKAWAGGAALRPGMGVFIGQSGDNQAHKHWAHQISVGLGVGPGADPDADIAAAAGIQTGAQIGAQIIVTVDGRRVQAAAVLIAADTLHQLAPGRVLSIYLDPTTASTACMPLPA